MSTIEVKVARVVAAKPQAVFDIWMDPASPGCQWYGAERAIVNPIVDGLFYWAVKHDARIWAHYGRFVRIERPGVGASDRSAANTSASGLVEYTWMSEGTHGLESLVSITFAPLGDETEVTLRHSGLPDDAMGRRHEEGWTWFLTNLADRFSVHEEQN